MTLRVLACIVGILTGIILTRLYDHSRTAQAVVFWLWTMDQRPARRWRR